MKNIINPTISVIKFIVFTGIMIASCNRSKVNPEKQYLAAGITDAGWPMVDPSMDDPAKPWCYFTHPITCIGMPFMPEAVQVTPEGNIFTGSAEFCLFWGNDAKPMSSRQRKFLNGYIPIVYDSWSENDIQYTWEAFGFDLDGFDESNTLQFIKLIIRNTGEKEANSRIVAAVRHSAYPSGPLRENAKKYYESDLSINDNRLILDNRIVCEYPSADYWEAVNGTPYAGPFKGKTLGVDARTEVGLAHYERNLKPNEKFELIFKFPRVSVDEKNRKYLEAMKSAEYDKYRNKAIDYWTNALHSYSVIHTPGEPKMEQSHRASAAHAMLATRTLAYGRTQTDGLPYPDLFLSTIFDYGQLYTNFNLREFVTCNFPQCLARQQPNGLFVDIAVSHGAIIHCAHGQTITFISDFIVNTMDKDLGKTMFPAIRKAVELISNEHKTQPHGLMSPAHAYDNEMIKGQWTSHNYWTLIGLRSAIRLAEYLNERELAEEWHNLYDDYEKTVLKAVKESAAPDGYVPTGLYGFLTGSAAREGSNFKEYQTDQDWENEMLLWPTELLSPGDHLVNGTLKRLRNTKYREGIMTYRNGQHLHQYITTRAINQYIANGQPNIALTDMYSAILHAGSATESFENMIRPWTDRDVEFCPPPHGWGCTNMSNTIRNLFVMEQGGRGGLDPKNRNLMLLNAVSPTWLLNGQALGIEKAPTSFGLVTILMTPRKDGADIAIRNEFHTQPHKIGIRIPYFVKLKSFTTDARESLWEGEVIYVSPDVTNLKLEWIINPEADKNNFQSLLLAYRQEVGHWDGKRNEIPRAPEGFLSKAEKRHPDEPLSLKLVLDAWKTEYKRRFDEHVRAGGTVKSFYPVPLQPACERISQVH